ncbi:MAG: DUF6179 domain-containing protein [Mobilitalea sp.]
MNHTNHIVKSHLINENTLDTGFYFQSLFHEACRLHLLAENQIERIQLEMVDLMAKEVARLTNDESSSVAVEKAQELLQSITYNIGVYLKTISDMDIKIELLKKEKMSVLFFNGMQTLSDKKEQANLVLKNMQKNSFKVDNYAYQDTIFTGIPEFMHDYNIEFEAHDLPGCIDYPLAQMITGLLGLEYIEEYLCRFTLEHNFLTGFNKDKVNLLLQGFSKESEHILVNIFELVLINALGCQLLGLEVTTLNIRENDRVWLQNNFEKLTMEEIAVKLNAAFAHISIEFFLDPQTVTYTKSLIPSIAARLNYNLQSDTLEKLFISFSEELPAEEFFEDGVMMEDEELREMIEQIEECEAITDKVAIIHENVHSLSDLTVLLDECFYEDEYLEVYALLGTTEIEILLRNVKEEAGPENLQEYETEKEWQQKLIEFYYHK